MEAKGDDFIVPTFDSIEEALKSTKDGDVFYIRQQDIQDLIKCKSSDETE